MTITKTTRPYELLVRYDTDGLVKGAHQVPQTVLADDGEVLQVQVGAAEPLAVDQVSAVLGATNAAQLAQIADLEAQVEALTTERDALQTQVDSYTPPQSGVATCTAVQGRLALLGAGMFDTVTGIINALPQNDATRIYWEYSTIWHRDNALITGLGTQIGLTDAQIDDLFTAARAI